jgi:hypothetical protein
MVQSQEQSKNRGDPGVLVKPRSYIELRHQDLESKVGYGGDNANTEA